MDVLLKLEPVAYVTCVCTLSHTSGDHGECWWSPWTGLPWWQEESSATISTTTTSTRCACHFISHFTHDGIHAYTWPTAPVLILVTRPSYVNLANSIKYVGDSRSYLSYRRSHYVLLPRGEGPVCVHKYCSNWETTTTGWYKWEEKGGECRGSKTKRLWKNQPGSLLLICGPSVSIVKVLMLKCACLFIITPCSKMPKHRKISKVSIEDMLSSSIWVSRLGGSGYQTWPVLQLFPDNTCQGAAQEPRQLGQLGQQWSGSALYMYVSTNTCALAKQLLAFVVGDTIPKYSYRQYHSFDTEDQCQILESVCKTTPIKRRNNGVSA